MYDELYLCNLKKRYSLNQSILKKDIFAHANNLLSNCHKM